MHAAQSPARAVARQAGGTKLATGAIHSSIDIAGVAESHHGVKFSAGSNRAMSFNFIVTCFPQQMRVSIVLKACDIGDDIISIACVDD